jgi:hypothetical protein
MSFGRGVGNIASGPISVVLLKNPRPVDRSAYAIGKYQGVVLYVVVCMALSALLGGVSFFAVAHEEKMQRRKWGVSAEPLADRDSVQLHAVVTEIEQV